MNINNKHESLPTEYGAKAFETILLIASHTDKYVTRDEFNQFKVDVNRRFDKIDEEIKILHGELSQVKIEISQIKIDIVKLDRKLTVQIYKMTAIITAALGGLMTLFKFIN